MIHRTTIIIPVIHGEARRARRALAWYAQHDCRVVMASGDLDGELSSIDPNHVVIARRGACWNELVTEAIGCVTTPYAVIADPDTLIHGEVLEPAASWLDAHQDYSGVQGRSAVALKVDGSFCFEPLDVIGMRQHVVADEPGTRITQVFDPYLDTCRALLRIETLREAFWTLARQENISQRRLGELLVACVAATDGKLRLLNGRWSIIEMRPKKTPVTGLVELLQEPAAEREIDAFLLGAVSHFMRRTGVDEETAKIHVRSGLDVYLNRHLPRAWRWEAMTSEERGAEAARIIGSLPDDEVGTAREFMNSHAEA